MDIDVLHETDLIDGVDHGQYVIGPLSCNPCILQHQLHVFTLEGNIGLFYNGKKHITPVMDLVQKAVVICLKSGCRCINVRKQKALHYLKLFAFLVKILLLQHLLQIPDPLLRNDHREFHVHPDLVSGLVRDNPGYGGVFHQRTHAVFNFYIRKYI